MHFERLTTETHPLYKEASALYGISFPPHEQRETASQRRILSDPAYHFDLIFDENTFVGEVLYWETERFIYIEHYCMLPEMRGKGYGKAALDALKLKNKTLILEIDPPVDDISRRRKHFYERCGFKENPYPHVHPPYHKGNHGHDLVILSCPNPITQAEYNAFAAYLNHTVMQNVFA